VDGGIIQLLVVGAFVVFSIMDGAARRKRAEQAEREAQGGEVRPEYMRAHGTTDRDDGEEAGGFSEPGAGGFSEPIPVVPGEFWEEMAQLARGEERPADRPVSFEQAGEASIRTSTPLIEERYEAETMARYPVVRSPKGFMLPITHSDPRDESVRPHDDEVEHGHPDSPDVWRRGGELASGPAPEMPRQGAEKPRPRKTASAWLYGPGGGGLEGLQRAIVLKEILGPPVSLRGSEHSD
jgi:hypothetical protein